MPKDIRTNSIPHRARACPYACSSKDSHLMSERPPVGNEKEWEEVRCPICMEHPHNAVLLICSSRDKGCQPCMCDTSSRHSNCLDQFCKSSPVGAQQEGNNVSPVFQRGIGEQALSGPNGSHGQQRPELVCPLCRGHVTGWMVVEAARKFMNSKTRSCALETCSFIGNYAELRKHARREHPYERPSEADPVRQSDWRRLEIQRDFEDAINVSETPVGDDFIEGDIGIEFLSELPDFLTEPPFDGGLFDLLVDSYSEAGVNEDINMLLDFECELSFTFLNEYPSMPWARNGVPSFAGGRSPSRSEGGTRSRSRGPRRSASRSNNNNGRPAAARSTN